MWEDKVSPADSSTDGVRGAGSAAFVAGTLLAWGRSRVTQRLSAVIWLSAGCLLAASLAAILVPAFPAGPAESADAGSARVHWLALFRLRAFVRVVVVAALVHGSHAMYDAFAVIRWTSAGISPATTASLWSELVAAEVVVFLVIGPRLLGVLNPAGALALAAVCGFVRWGVMAQTTDVAASRWSSPYTDSPSRCSTWPACASSRIPCRGSWPEQRRLSMAS